jgi:hypothetical protein
MTRPEIKFTAHHQGNRNFVVAEFPDGKKYGLENAVEILEDSCMKDWLVSEFVKIRAMLETHPADDEG